MAENETLDMYKEMIKSTLQLKEQYEIYDDNLVRVVHILCDEAVNQGNTWITNKAAPYLRDLVDYSREQIYKTVIEMLDFYVSRYRRACVSMEETPESFSTDAKHFSDAGVPDDFKAGGMKSYEEIVAACEWAADKMKQGYNCLDGQYQDYKKVYERNRDSFIREDADETDEWNRQCNNALGELEAPVDDFVKLLYEVAERFRSDSAGS